MLELVVGGILVLEGDRDLAITLLPNADNTIDLGSTTRHYGTGYFKDDVVVALDTRGFVAKSANGKYWRITVNDTGNLVTTDLGTTEP